MSEMQKVKIKMPATEHNYTGDIPFLGLGRYSWFRSNCSSELNTVLPATC